MKVSKLKTSEKLQLIGYGTIAVAYLTLFILSYKRIGH